MKVQKRFVIGLAVCLPVLVIAAFSWVQYRHHLERKLAGNETLAEPMMLPTNCDCQTPADCKDYQCNPLCPPEKYCSKKCVNKECKLECKCTGGISCGASPTGCCPNYQWCGQDGCKYVTALCKSLTEMPCPDSSLCCDLTTHHCKNLTTLNANGQLEPGWSCPVKPPSPDCVPGMHLETYLGGANCPLLVRACCPDGSTATWTPSPGNPCEATHQCNNPGPYGCNMYQDSCVDTSATPEKFLVCVPKGQGCPAGSSPK